MGKTDESPALEFFTPDPFHELKIPLASYSVSAGFPSPATDYLDSSLDLNELVVRRPSATFYVKVKGQSMIDADIKDGDLLVVDRSIDPTNNTKVIAYVDGEFTVKKISKIDGKLYLIPKNPNYKPIEITESMNFQVWGVVTYVIHKPR